MREHVRVINSAAPVRICDIGGWTDTWFAREGAVCSIAVSPYAYAQIAVRPRRSDGPHVVLHALDFGDRYAISPGEPVPRRHPLLEAAIEEVGVPEGLTVEVSVHSEAPAGASMGTSAAVAVAVLGGLARLARIEVPPDEIARLAHRLEVDRLGLQSGVQDQIASALGGVNLIEITEYPRAVAVPLPVAGELWRELERRLLLVFLGQPHVSSLVHEMVISELAGEGHASPRLQVLRDLAYAAGEALLAGDLPVFAEAMRCSTDAQRALHPELVNEAAERIIDICLQHDAAGWKVNGAGGEGGSLTILGPRDLPRRRALVAALRAADPRWQLIPVHISGRGLRVWEGTSRRGV